MAHCVQPEGCTNERAKRANHQHSAVLGPKGRSAHCAHPEGCTNERAKRANHQHSAVLGPKGRSAHCAQPEGCTNERAKRANHQHSAVLGPQGRRLIARSPKGAPMSDRPDVAVVGAGILGLATARELLIRHPDLAVTVLDKEDRVGSHQTGHNSGVLHAGLYYVPGSLKARLCREGKAAMERFAEEHGIPLDRCGKLVVALDESELGRFEDLRRRAEANGVEGLEVIGPERHRRARAPRRRHPGAVVAGHRHHRLRPGGPGAGRRRGRAGAGRSSWGARSCGIERRSADDRAATRPPARSWPRHVVACAGLHADRVAHQLGDDGRERIVPFRGDYYTLAGGAKSLVNGSDLPGPRPPLPVPRRPLDQAHRRRGAGRAQRGAGLRPRGLPAARRQRRGTWPARCATGVPAARRPLLADRRDRDVARRQQAGVPAGAPALRARPAVRRTSGSGRPGSAPRPWTPTGRWSTTSGSAATTGRSRPQRPVAGRNGLAGHRRGAGVAGRGAVRGPGYLS